MTNYIHVVTISTKGALVSELARAFTSVEDANAFIEDCKKNEPRTMFEYGIKRIELDGDPLTGY